LRLYMLEKFVGGLLLLFLPKLERMRAALVLLSFR
jgi:hypothetical protein